MTPEERERYLDLIPRPDPERSAIVRRLGLLAVDLDAEADSRAPELGTWNDMVRSEIRRAASALRLVATLVLNGGMSEGAGMFWIRAANDYLALVRRADRRGVIR